MFEFRSIFKKSRYMEVKNSEMKMVRKSLLSLQECGLNVKPVVKSFIIKI